MMVASTLIEDGVVNEVGVPKPYGYFNDTLIMELVTDAAGERCSSKVN